MTTIFFSNALATPNEKLGFCEFVQWMHMFCCKKKMEHNVLMDGFYCSFLAGLNDCFKESQIKLKNK